MYFISTSSYVVVSAQPTQSRVGGMIGGVMDEYTHISICVIAGRTPGDLGLTAQQKERVPLGFRV
jgi:hypothetical protein